MIDSQADRKMFERIEATLVRIADALERSAPEEAKFLGFTDVQWFRLIQWSTEKQIALPPNVSEAEQVEAFADSFAMTFTGLPLSTCIALRSAWLREGGPMDVIDGADRSGPIPTVKGN